MAMPVHGGTRIEESYYSNIHPLLYLKSEGQHAWGVIPAGNQTHGGTTKEGYYYIKVKYSPLLQAK